MDSVQAIIKSLRSLGLTQSEIGRRTGIPQPRISRWENGEGPEMLDDPLRLADLLHEERRSKANKPEVVSAQPQASGRPS